MVDLGIVSNPGTSAKYPHCYVVDIEAFLRAAVNGTAANGAQFNFKTYRACDVTNTIDGYRDYVSATNRLVNIEFSRARVSEFSLVFDSPNARQRRVNHMLDSEGWLTDTQAESTQANPNDFAFAYDGVYVDRTPEDFAAATATGNNPTTGQWNDTSTPTFGKQGTQFPSVSLVDTLVATELKSKDPHADMPLSFRITDDGYYYHKHLMGELYSEANRGALLPARTASGQTMRKVFAYDKAATDVFSPVSYDSDSGAVWTNIPDGGLYVGDYVEYNLYVGAQADSKLPMESISSRFEVPEGQRIVGWEIAKKSQNGTWVDDNTCGTSFPGNDPLPVTAFMMRPDDTNKRPCEPQVDYSLADTAAVPSLFAAATAENTVDNRVIEFQVGKTLYEQAADGSWVLTDERDRVVKPGEGVRIRVITQLTDELSNTAYDTLTPNTAWHDDRPNHYLNVKPRAWFYTVSAPKHGFTQYRAWHSENTNGRNPFLFTDDDGLGSGDIAHEHQVDYKVAGIKQYGVGLRSDLTYYHHANDATRMDTVTNPDGTTVMVNRDHREDPQMAIKFTGTSPSGPANVDGNPAQLTVSNLINPTYHSANITVTVNLYDENLQKGFELTQTPKIAASDTTVRQEQGAAVDLRYPPTMPARPRPPPTACRPIPTGARPSASSTSTPPGLIPRWARGRARRKFSTIIRPTSRRATWSTSTRSAR